MDPQMQQDTIVNQPRKESHTAFILGILAIVLLIIAALYFWGKKINTETMPYSETATTVETKTTTTQSDDVDSIEADLNAATVSSFDEEYAGMDSAAASAEAE